ncbi:MAG: beta-mannosidase [Oscillospiraceae bacterium]|nr:beta-mannosidase [Oscillospiraceae bacterium]
MHEAPLYWDKTYLESVKRLKEGWLECDVPADVRIPLMQSGAVRDPVKADYCFESEWIEKRSWWFIRDFYVEDADLNAGVLELVMEALDSNSDIFVNGQHIGRHISVHWPFIRNIKNLVCAGKNELAVRVTTGLETVTDEQLSEINWAVCREDDNGGKYRSDYRRAFVRRPQYTVGWDWGPRVVTCGITGDVYLRKYSKIAIREASVSTACIAGDARLHVMVNVENLNILSTASGDVRVEVLYDGEVCAAAEEKNTLFTSGLNYLDFNISIKNPKLWWPAAYGGQPLYEIRVSARAGESEDIYDTIWYGIRTIELDTSVIEGEHRNFALIVNGVKIFCKGGNWIPNDSLYVRTTDEKYQALIEEAVEANFNMLRVWGGGLYERNIFYSLCDRAGLLVWHDFMFACTAYPDHLPWFRQEAYQEMDYQTKRLRSHPCIALFCGSNENHWLFNHYDNPRWGIEFKPERQYGMYIYNVMAKEAVRRNCGFIPYWNSSPYGGELPNGDTVGDVHRWHQNGFMSKVMEERIEPKGYDEVESKFVSEYGYVGPCCLQTTMDYLDNQPIDRSNLAWEIHNNVFEKETVCAGIEKQYTDNPDKLGIEEYILYGGMVHSLMLGYSLEAIRFKENCGGAVFWMYNDTWGEIGWTIIDYYLRRKISYYGVKRAFAPVKLSMRAVGGDLVVQACNDTAAPVAVHAQLGYKSFDGAADKCRPVSFRLEPYSRAYVHREPLPREDYRSGSIVLIPENGPAAPVMLRMHDTRELIFGGADIEVLENTGFDGGKKVTLTSKKYAHGVYVKGDYKCSDNYFDLVPGEVKTITVRCPADVQIEILKVK